MADAERSRRLRVVFFGSGAFGLPTLEMLRDNHDLSLVVSQPARPAGRGKKLTSTPVAQWIVENASDTPVVTPELISTKNAVEDVLAQGADVIVVIAYGQKIPASIYESSPCINLHGSVLPKWRGAAPIHRAILGGDTHTGVCVIHVVEKMDAGNVITASTLHIDQGWTTSELHDELARQGPACVRKVLDAIGAQLSIAGHVQNDAHVFYARKIHREDAWIDFGRSSDECRRRINGLSPSPGVAVRCGRIEFKVVRSVTADADIMPQAASGQLVDVVRGRVRCGDFRDLVMLQVQPTGKHVMNWEDFARGYPLSACETLVSVQPIKS